MIKKIGSQILDATTEQAKISARLRKNYNFHQLDDPVQRMLNAIEPDSYVRPHKHEDPDKMEIFLTLRGKGCVFIFDDDGVVKDTCIIEAGSDLVGVEIAPRIWHTIISLQSGSVFFEIKDGPYVEATDKDFAPWAPKPDQPSAKTYLEHLKGAMEADIKIFM